MALTAGPSAATTIVGVMGDPVAHSLSPLIHNTAFDALGMDWVCVGFPTPAGEAPAAVAGMRALGIVGMSVTMPHKAAVIGSLDWLTDDALLLGAVNCIVNRDGTLEGHNTDGQGFVMGLRHDFDVEVEGLDCAVIGAGGAARSAIAALGRAGANSVTIVNRSPERARSAAELADVARVGTTDDIPACDLVVNATPVGMAARAVAAEGIGDVAMPCEPTLLREGQLVVDMVYEPLETPWLVAASARGARVSNGTSMLVHQAAVAFELWTGAVAPVVAMSVAVSDVVRSRG